jgi:hypothetical protein
VSTTTSPNGAHDVGERCRALEQECEELRERVALLENPPKPPRRRVRTIVADGLFVLLGGLVVAAIAGGVLIAAGVWKLDSEPSGAASQAAPAQTVAEEAPASDEGPFAGGAVTTQEAPAETAVAGADPTDAGAMPAAPVHFVASAVGGDCWLQVRRRDADGKVLWEGILLEGDSTAFDGQRFWIRMGDPTNLRLDVNGERVVDLPSLAADMVIGETGASVVPTS